MLIRIANLFLGTNKLQCYIGEWRTDQKAQVRKLAFREIARVRAARVFFSLSSQNFRILAKKRQTDRFSRKSTQIKLKTLVITFSGSQIPTLNT